MMNAMKDIDLRKVDRSALRDRSTVRIDPEAPTEERIRAWIEQLGNPYVYLDGGVVVKLSFADKGHRVPHQFPLPCRGLTSFTNRAVRRYNTGGSKKELHHRAHGFVSCSHTQDRASGISDRQ